jgi:hypothetical protein
MCDKVLKEINAIKRDIVRTSYYSKEGHLGSSFHEIFSARYKYGNQKLFNMKSRIQKNINGN